MSRLIKTLLMMSIWFYGFGQSESDFSFIIMKNNAKKMANKEYLSLVDEPSQSRFENLYVLPFLFYKNFISSQDYEACNFHPSCSEYSLIYMRKLGFVKGGLAAFDRLSRCHPLSLKQYTYDIDRRKFIDP